MTVFGSPVGEVPKNLSIYKSCPLQWEALPVAELTPDMFITAHAKFVNFHRTSRIGINCITPVSFLDCQYVQRLFETLYDSSLYDVVQKFDDACSSYTLSPMEEQNLLELSRRFNSQAAHV